MAQAVQGRSFGRSLLSVIGAAAIIISAFSEWLNGNNAFDMPLSSLYRQTFEHTPKFGVPVGGILVLLGLLAILGLATKGFLTRVAGALAILVFAGWMIQLYARGNPVNMLPGIGAWLALIGGMSAATGGG
ncbi:MAG: hypothetical protein ABR600_05250 [Actinomycetota bacterium]